jgi:hypothetical protein
MPLWIGIGAFACGEGDGSINEGFTIKAKKNCMPCEMRNYLSARTVL